MNPETIFNEEFSKNLTVQRHRAASAHASADGVFFFGDDEGKKRPPAKGFFLAGSKPLHDMVCSELAARSCTILPHESVKGTAAAIYRDAVEKGAEFFMIDCGIRHRTDAFGRNLAMKIREEDPNAVIISIFDDDLDPNVRKISTLAIRRNELNRYFATISDCVKEKTGRSTQEEKGSLIVVRSHKPERSGTEADNLSWSNTNTQEEERLWNSLFAGQTPAQEDAAIPEEDDAGQQQEAGQAQDAEMRMEVMEITPALAAEFLRHNKSNRPVVKNQVARLARAMQEGSFETLPAGISFDRDGNLIDGQHRLNAVIKSGCTVKMAVTRNAKSSIYMDRGVRRTTADNLQMFYNGKELYSKRNVAAINLIAALSRRPIIEGDVVKALDGNEKLIRDLDEQYIVNKGINGATAFMVSALLVLKAGGDKERLHQYSFLLAYGSLGANTAMEADDLKVLKVRDKIMAKTKEFRAVTGDSGRIEAVRELVFSMLPYCGCRRVSREDIGNKVYVLANKFLLAEP